MKKILNQQQNTDGQTASAEHSAFADLLAKHPEALRTVRPTEVVSGTVLDIAPNTLYVDLGNLGVGVVYGRELMDAQDTFRSAKKGDDLEAVVIDPENDDGYVELSLRSASEERAWDELRKKERGGEIFPVQILEANKGGLILRINGITGFLPVSQLNATHYPRVEGGDKQKILDHLKKFIGETFDVRVIAADQRDGKLIVSEKEAMTKEMGAALEKLSEGTVVSGHVSGVVDFGVFVKFEWKEVELEGLVHISELAWQRIDNPSEFAKLGQKIEALVIGVDGTRISLSMKKMREDPWLTAGKRYKTGDTIEGEVIKVTPFGAFVRLDEDIHGLAHVSELTKEEALKPKDIVTPGETRTFRIIGIEPSEHRLGLSLVSSNATSKKKKITKARTTKKDKENKKKSTPTS